MSSFIHNGTKFPFVSVYMPSSIFFTLLIAFIQFFFLFPWGSQLIFELRNFSSPPCPNPKNRSITKTDEQEGRGVSKEIGGSVLMPVWRYMQCSKCGEKRKENKTWIQKPN